MDLNIQEWLEYSKGYPRLHHLKNPKADASENPRLFGGTFVILSKLLNEYTTIAERLRLSVLADYRDELDCSHDEATTIMCMELMHGNRSPVPVFHRARLHPRDIIAYGYAKYPYLFFIFLPILSIIMLISAYDSYKYRGGNKIIKTDGKILLLLRCKALKMNLTYKLCLKIIAKNNYFRSMPLIFMRYYGQKGFNAEGRDEYGYPTGLSHPNVNLAVECHERGLI